MASGGKFLKNNQEPQKKSNTPKWLKVIIIVVAVLLTLIVLVGGGILIYAKILLGNVKQPTEEEKNTDVSYEEMMASIAARETEDVIVEETTEETTVETTIPYSDGNYGKTGKVINILLVGQDARIDENHKNSDTVILCSLNKETKILTLSSFLRDAYVKLADYKIHTCGYNRLTFAYALGYSWGGDQGAFDMINNTLINNFGTTIDHTIEINLECFEKILEAVGPISVELDETEVKYMNKALEKSGYDRRLEVGTNDLYSVSALIYARMRHDTLGGNDGSDMKRTNRQRIVVSQVLENIKNLSISEINDIVKEVISYIITDMSDADIATYLLEVVPVLPYLSIESVQIPVDGTYRGVMKDVYGDGMLSAVLEVYNFQQNKLLMEAICNGTERPNW